MREKYPDNLAQKPSQEDLIEEHCFSGILVTMLNSGVNKFFKTPIFILKHGNITIISSSSNQ